MVLSVARFVRPYGSEDDYHHDGDLQGHSGASNRPKLFQQSVSLTAKMWPQENSSESGRGAAWEWGKWRIASEHLPLWIGAFCGGALVLLLLLAALLWRCCVAPQHNKDYRVKMGSSERGQPSPFVPIIPSHSAVYLDPKSGRWCYNSQLVGSPLVASSSKARKEHWLYGSHILSLDRGSAVPRSISVPSHAAECLESIKRPSRPHSQSVALSPSRLPSFQLGLPCSLPQISEFNPQSNQYRSNSLLDDCTSLKNYSGICMMKTQSLPACVRSKRRPLSTADDPAELYAKVNFSKKRKNRMRNNEAAIIALSKSRSQFLHKDTDSLVNNEAVIVYNERTAL